MRSLSLLSLVALLGCKGPAGASAAPPSETATLVLATTTSADTGSSSAPPTVSAAPSEIPTTSASTAQTASEVSAGPCPEGMVLVAGGALRRHKPGKRKTVSVATYCLDRTEVTVASYKACVKDKKCSPRCLEIGRCTAAPSDADWPDPKEAIRATTFCNGSRTDRDSHPLNCVSFDEAKGYCQSHDRRLPTGDEWEWAAVGDKPAPIFPWGPAAPAAEELCWGRPYSRPSTCLPGTIAKDTTRDGVMDMTGNLSEWVVEDHKGRPVARLRGANWFSIDDGYVQAALWGFESLSSRSEVFGFRCARDAISP